MRANFLFNSSQQPTYTQRCITPPRAKLNLLCRALLPMNHRGLMGDLTPVTSQVLRNWYMCVLMSLERRSYVLSTLSPTFFSKHTPYAYHTLPKNNHHHHKPKLAICQATKL